MRKIRESTAEDYSGQISWEVLSDEDAMFGNPFQGLLKVQNEILLNMDRQHVTLLVLLDLILYLSAML